MLVDLFATSSPILFWLNYSVFLCAFLPGEFDSIMWSKVLGPLEYYILLVKLEPSLPQIMLKFERNGWKWFSGGGGGIQHCWVGDGVKKLSVELDYYVIFTWKSFSNCPKFFWPPLHLHLWCWKCQTTLVCPLLPALTGFDISSCCMVFF